MYIYLGQNIIGETAGNTAKFCLLFDKLFDSVNGNFNKVVDDKIYRTGITNCSPHHQLWQESLKILDSMRFINPSTNKPSTPQPPTVQNWIITIRSEFKMSAVF